MHKKKTLAILILITVSMSLMAGGAPEQAGQKAQADAAGPVRVLLSKGGSGTVIGNGIKAYAASSGKPVEIIEYPYAEVREKQLLDLTSKAGDIDMISIDGPIWLAELNPFLDPIDSYIQRDKVDTGIFIGSMLDMFRAAGGKIFGLPVRIGGWVLIYRTDLFAAAGLKPPVTMDEFLSTAQKLSANNVYGFAAAFKQTNYLVAQWVPFLYSFGGNILDKDMKKAAFNEPKAIAATKFLIDLFRVHKVVPPSAIDYEQTNLVTVMQQGLTAMAITYSPYFLVMNDPKTSKFPGKFAVSPVMPFDKASGLSTGITELSGWGFGLNQASKRKDSTWSLIKYMGSEATQRTLAVKYNNSPTVASVYNDPDYLKVYPEAKAVLNSLSNAKSRPGVRQWTKIEDTLAKELSAAVNGLKTIEQALADAEAQVNSILAQ